MELLIKKIINLHLHLDVALTSSVYLLELMVITTMD